MASQSNILSFYEKYSHGVTHGKSRKIRVFKAKLIKEIRNYISAESPAKCRRFFSGNAGVSEFIRLNMVDQYNLLNLQAAGRRQRNIPRVAGEMQRISGTQYQRARTKISKLFDTTTKDGKLPLYETVRGETKFEDDLSERIFGSGVKNVSFSVPDLHGADHKDVRETIINLEDENDYESFISKEDQPDSGVEKLKHGGWHFRSANLPAETTEEQGDLVFSLSCMNYFGSKSHFSGLYKSRKERHLTAPYHLFYELATDNRYMSRRTSRASAWAQLHNTIVADYIGGEITRKGKDNILTYYERAMSDNDEDLFCEEMKEILDAKYDDYKKAWDFIIGHGPFVSGGGDDLTALPQISDARQTTLKDAGHTSFRQVAYLTRAEFQAIVAGLGDDQADAVLEEALRLDQLDTRAFENSMPSRIVDVGKTGRQVIAYLFYAYTLEVLVKEHKIANTELKLDYETSEEFDSIMEKLITEIVSRRTLPKQLRAVADKNEERASEAINEIAECVNVINSALEGGSQFFSKSAGLSRLSDVNARDVFDLTRGSGALTRSIHELETSCEYILIGPSAPQMSPEQKEFVKNAAIVLHGLFQFIITPWERTVLEKKLVTTILYKVRKGLVTHYLQ